MQNGQNTPNNTLESLTVQTESRGSTFRNTIKGIAVGTILMALSALIPSQADAHEGTSSVEEDNAVYLTEAKAFTNEHLSPNNLNVAQAQLDMFTYAVNATHTQFGDNDYTNSDDLMALFLVNSDVEGTNAGKVPVYRKTHPGTTLSGIPYVRGENNAIDIPEGATLRQAMEYLVTGRSADSRFEAHGGTALPEVVNRTDRHEDILKGLEEVARALGKETEELYDTPITDEEEGYTMIPVTVRPEFFARMWEELNAYDPNAGKSDIAPHGAVIPAPEPTIPATTAPPTQQESEPAVEQPAQLSEPQPAEAPTPAEELGKCSVDDISARLDKAEAKRDTQIRDGVKEPTIRSQLVIEYVDERAECPDQTDYIDSREAASMEVLKQYVQDHLGDMQLRSLELFGRGAPTGRFSMGGAEVFVNVGNSDVPEYTGDHKDAVFYADFDEFRTDNDDHMVGTRKFDFVTDLDMPNFDTLIAFTGGWMTQRDNLGLGMDDIDPETVAIPDGSVTTTGSSHDTLHEYTTEGMTPEYLDGSIAVSFPVDLESVNHPDLKLKFGIKGGYSATLGHGVTNYDTHIDTLTTAVTQNGGEPGGTTTNETDTDTDVETKTTVETDSRVLSIGAEAGVEGIQLNDRLKLNAGAGTNVFYNTTEVDTDETVTTIQESVTTSTVNIPGLDPIVEEGQPQGDTTTQNEPVPKENIDSVTVPVYGTAGLSIDDIMDFDVYAGGLIHSDQDGETDNSGFIGAAVLTANTGHTVLSPGFFIDTTEMQWDLEFHTNFDEVRENVFGEYSEYRAKATALRFGVMNEELQAAYLDALRRNTLVLRHPGLKLHLGVGVPMSGAEEDTAELFADGNGGADRYDATFDASLAYALKTNAGMFAVEVSYDHHDQTTPGRENVAEGRLYFPIGGGLSAQIFASVANNSRILRGSETEVQVGGGLVFVRPYTPGYDHHFGQTEESEAPATEAGTLEDAVQANQSVEAASDAAVSAEGAAVSTEGAATGASIGGEAGAEAGAETSTEGALQTGYIPGTSRYF